MSTQYVQHISGQGEKWEVTDEQETVFVVKGVYRNNRTILSCPVLPKSEYRLCEPPERWVDITERCDMSGLVLREGTGPITHPIFSDKGYLNKEYHIRKVRCCDAGGLECGCGKGEWAFIIEKREP